MRLMLIGFAWALTAALAAEPGSQIQIEYIATEFGGGVVKGAPYSAESATETTQTLADGNRISHKSTASIYRDSQGRTRREQTVGSIGLLAVSEGGEHLHLITISDPVAGVSYALDPRTQTATKAPLGAVTPHLSLPSGALRVLEERSEDTLEVALPEPQPSPAPVKTVVRAEVIRHDAASGQGKTEQLGKQVMEGIEVEGTRETTTIPAGQIGNERPIEMISERWYSPRLQTVVTSRRSDPRTGETVYRLTNIHLSEPPASLFQVPAGYTVKQAPQRGLLYIQKKEKQ